MCFKQCILMKHSPLAWFQMLTVLQLPGSMECGGEEWIHLKTLCQQFHFQDIPLGKSHDPSEAGFVTFLPLPLVPALSCGSRLRRPGNTGARTKVKGRMASENGKAGPLGQATESVTE